MPGPPQKNRIALSVGIGVFAAICLVLFWKESAQAPWSSDPWLINAALGVMAAGPLAVVALVVLVCWNFCRRKR